MINSRNLFWDSCVFIRYLTRKPAAGLHDLDRFVEEAQNGDRTIHYSTIALTEIRPRYLKDTKHGSISDFFADMGSQFSPIDTNPNILLSAGELRDATPTNPSDSNTENQRSISMGDSIHLMSCLYLRDTLQVSDVIFHTFDEGKGKNWEGRCVPILGFERWFPADARTQRVNDVCGLTRCKPEHPQRDLWTEIIGESDTVSD